MSNKKELIGIIKNKKLDQVRNKKSEHLGNQYWRLAVDLENSEIKEILVFKEWLERKAVWQELEQWELRNYLDKRYLFTVQRKPGAGQFFRLLDWELLNNVRTFDKDQQILKDYGSHQ